MKIFVIDPSLFSPTYDAQFCEALGGLGHDVRLIGRKPRAWEEVEERNFRLHPHFYRITESLPGFLAPLAKLGKGIEHAFDMHRLVTLAEREKPDVIHVEWSVLPLIDRHFFRKLAKIAPMVLTVHNTVPFHGASSSKLMLKGHEDIFAPFDHFVPHTETIRNHLLGRGIDEGRMTQLPHPVIRLPEPRVQTTGDSRGGPLHILFFGNIKPYKGVDILVHAGLDLARERDDFHITIAGKPFMPLDGLHREIEEAGAGPFFSIIPRYLSEQELADTIARSDIIVFPYREIDASGAFSCATQFGRPIVATDIGAFAEEPVRNHVLRIPVENTPALRHALAGLLEDAGERERLAGESRKLHERMYSWERFAGDCLDIYRRLASAAPHRAR
ncbi:MAG: glycosyltransferase family 4 protein [Geminicoccaceae bacterium]